MSSKHLFSILILLMLGLTLSFGARLAYTDGHWIESGRAFVFSGLITLSLACVRISYSGSFRLLITTCASISAVLVVIQWIFPQSVLSLWNSTLALVTLTTGMTLLQLSTFRIHRWITAIVTALLAASFFLKWNSNEFYWILLGGAVIVSISTLISLVKRTN